MSPGVLLITYCGAILLASLAGGWIPLFLRLTHTKMQVATSFVAGLMLGVGLLHLLPHAWMRLQSIDRAAGWLLGGFLVMFFIQRFFHFHHHDVPSEDSGENHSAEASQACGHAHSRGHEEHDHHHHTEELTLAERSASKLTWTGAALGLALHTLIDGFALATSVQADSIGQTEAALFGFGTFLVIILHKPFDAMAIGALMAASGSSRLSRHLVNGLFALAIPVGVLLFQFGASEFSAEGGRYLGSALAFAAGTFLCIASSDLLPELQFHAHDRVKLSVALLSGLALAIAIGAFETSGHEHHADAVPKTIPLEQSRPLG